MAISNSQAILSAQILKWLSNSSTQTGAELLIKKCVLVEIMIYPSPGTSFLWDVSMADQVEHWIQLYIVLVAGGDA